MSFLIDSYDVANQDDYENIASAGRLAVGQSFTGKGGVLNSCKFWLAKGAGSPTGNLVAKLYSHSGVYGTSSVGATLLATSDNLDASTLTTYPTFTGYTFTFSGAQKVPLTQGTKYVMVVEASGIVNDGSTVRVGEDSSSSTHDGNECEYTAGPSWSANASDVCFEVYIDNTRWGFFQWA